jgi:hypothetical protein
MSEKVTKVEMYGLIAEALAEVEGTDELVEFANHEAELLTARAERAKERAAAKREKGDEFTAKVAGALTDEFQTRQDIYDAVGDDEEDGLSLGKVQARLTQLVKSGAAAKDQVSVEVDGKTKKVMGYRIA